MRNWITQRYEFPGPRWKKGSSTYMFDQALKQVTDIETHLVIMSKHFMWQHPSNVFRQSMRELIELQIDTKYLENEND